MLLTKSGIELESGIRPEPIWRRIMKIAVKGVIAIALACGALAVAQENQLNRDPIAVSVLQSETSERVVLQEPSAPLPEPSTPAVVTLPAPMPNSCCEPRCPEPCIPTTFCLVDPCGCSHEACVEVPACCAGEQPNVSWRGGLFGRQTATLCWSCCDFEARVIVTRNGKVKVRD